MQLNNNEKTKKQDAFLRKKNQELRELNFLNRNDFKKRRELREQRLRQINSYRDEQVAALKH